MSETIAPLVRDLVAWVAAEPRPYREVIAVSIQILRPCAEVVTASLDAIKVEVRRFDPHLVILQQARHRRQWRHTRLGGAFLGDLSADGSVHGRA